MDDNQNGSGPIFLPSDNDLITSQDPQADVAGQGFNILGSAIAQSEPVQNALTGKGLKEYEQTVKRAIKGDPGAQMNLASRSLNTAMGSINDDAAARTLMNQYTREQQLARAKDLGFNTEKTFYHGTDKDLSHLDPSGNTEGVTAFYTEHPEYANDFAAGPSANVQPVFLKSNNTFDYENSKHVAEVLKQLPRIKETQSSITLPTGQILRKAALAKGDFIVLRRPEVVQAIKDAGFDSMHILSGGDTKNIAVFEPHQVRSKFADFDPAKKTQSGLSFADGGMMPNTTDSLNAPDPTINSLNPQDSTTDSLSLSQAHSDTPVPAMMPETVSATQANVFNPNGQLVSIPQDSLSDAIQHGYRPASPQEVDQHFKSQEHEEKYGSPSQQAISAVEGIGQGIAGPLSTAFETHILGVPPEDILARSENALPHIGGEILGLGGSLAGGVGLGSLAAKIGSKGAALIGLGELGSAAAKLPAAAKIGSAAVTAGIENMVIAGSDEASKFILNDPKTSVDTAISGIGLAGILGGAIGGAASGAHGLWKSQFGKDVGEVLDAVTTKVGGTESGLVDPVERAITDSGLDVPPEIKSAMVGDPSIRQMFSSLNESATKSGLKTQESLQKFRELASEGVAGALGKTPREIEGLSELSAYDAGDKVKKSLVQSIKDTLEPISESFSNIKKAFSKEVLPPETSAEISANIGDLVSSEGYGLSPSSPQYKVIRTTLKELPNIKTLEDLRRYQSILSNNTDNPELRRLGGQLKNILRDAEDKTILGSAREGLPSTEEVELARSGYRESMNVIDSLNDRLQVGRYDGPGSFIKALKEMSPEDVLKRLSPKNDGELITQLSERFPEVAGNLKNYYLSDIMKKAASQAAPGEIINTKKLFSAIEGMSPELRNFLIPAESQVKIHAIQTMVDAIPRKMNPSGTAKALDSLLGNLPSSVLGLATLVVGHDPSAAVIVGYLAKKLSRDVPDAAKLALLKFLGTDKPIHPGAFKSMVEFIAGAFKGEQALSKGAKSIFSTTATDAIPLSMRPTAGDRNKLDKFIDQYAGNAEKIAGIPGESGHYLSDHASVLSMTGASALSYLSTLKPATQPTNALDKKPVTNFVQQRAYDNALNIAQQPLIVLNKIKSGQLSVQDVVSLRTMYPSMYSRMSNKLLTEISDTTSKGKTIPYVTRTSLSLFLGQPLDSTLTPQAIMSSQPQDPSQINSGPARAKPGTKAFQKIGAESASPSQQRLMNKQDN